MKKLFLAAFFCILIFIKNIFYVRAQEFNYGIDKIITRAQVAKMLCFIYADKKSILEKYKSRDISFIDSSPDDWFDKYINFIFDKGIMLGTQKNKFEPDNALTLNQAQYLLDKININNKIKLKLTDQNQDKFISYSLWTKLFISAIKDLGLDNNIKQENIIILATRKQNDNILNGFIISDKDYYTCDDLEYLDFDFCDKAINALVRDKEILAVLDYNNEFSLRAKILKKLDNKLLILTGPVKRFLGVDFSFDRKYKTLCKELIFERIYGLKIDSGKIVDIVGLDNSNGRKKN